MYCPNCATQNIPDARYCRACGANLSLVPQALSGQLPDTRREHIEKAIRRRREPNLGRGITKAFMGFGFLLVAAALFFARRSPGFGEIWLLIPAFALLGRGIGEIVRVISAQSAPKTISAPGPAQPTGQLQPQQRYDPLPAPSVTEGTTRHMDPVPERRRETN